MQKSDNNQVAVKIHRRVTPSTTLNRKYVKRPDICVRKVADSMVKAGTTIKPGVATKSEAVKNTATLTRSGVKIGRRVPVNIEPPARIITPTRVNSVRMNSMSSVSSRSSMRSMMGVQPVSKKLTATEIKDREIKKALATVAKNNASEKNENKRKKTQGLNKVHFGFGRVLLAMSCAAVAVFAIVYFVNLNMPDLSLRVAAMQTGIEASYPSYVPRDFSLSDITSESGKVTLNFRNTVEDGAFSLIEESSSWDSSALLANYVTPTYRDNYTVIREQGLTLYVSNSNACWVNGGIVYKIVTTSGTLTKKQIKAIATSL